MSKRSYQERRRKKLFKIRPEMELLYFFGLFMILAKSDAVLQWDTPTVDGTAACPTLGTVAEGTSSGALVTAAHSGEAGTVTLDVVDDTKFAVDADTKVVSIKAALDFDTLGASVDVKITAVDSDAATTTITATCVLTITDIKPMFEAYGAKIILPEDAAEDDQVTTLVCTEGAGPATPAFASGDDSTAKFTSAITDGTITVTKTGAAFDVATKSYYTLTFTCTDTTSTATATVEVCLNDESNCPSNKAFINHGVLAGLVVPTLLAIYHLI